MSIQEVLAAIIEQLRKERKISNDTAKAASVALQLTGDEAMLENRLINRGSDPASLQLVLTGDISEEEKLKVLQLLNAAVWLQTEPNEEQEKRAQDEYDKIVSLPFLRGEISGVEMRIYESDLGFAAAYWSGEEYAAVRQGSNTFVGSQGRSLEELGVKVDKTISPTVGIIFGK